MGRSIRKVNEKVKNHWLDKKKEKEEKSLEKFKGLFQRPDDSQYGYSRPRRFNLMPKAFYYPKT